MSISTVTLLIQLVTLAYLTLFINYMLKVQVTTQKANNGGLFKADQVESTIYRAFPYIDKSGNVLFYHVEFREKGKQPSFARWTSINGHWFPQNPNNYIPFYCEHLMDTSDTIIVVNGEWNADALNKMGLTTTSLPMGIDRIYDDVYYENKLMEKRTLLLVGPSETEIFHAKRVYYNLKYDSMCCVAVLPFLDQDTTLEDWLLTTGSKKQLVAEINRQLLHKGYALDAIGRLRQLGEQYKQFIGGQGE